MATYVISGAASGIGAATARHFADDRVITVDLHDADVECDLGTHDGRATAVDTVAAWCDDGIDGLITCAGIAGGTSGAPLVSVNYFGTTALLEGLRPLLTVAGGAAVTISSNSTTCQPAWPGEIARACLEGDEARARDHADHHGPLHTYPATKAAIAWYVRTHAVGSDWAGAGVRLNAVAPSFVTTAMTDAMRADPDMAKALDAFPVPLGGPAHPDEIAATIGFLLGSSASSVCGSVLFADGGTDALLRGRDWPAVWQP